MVNLNKSYGVVLIIVVFFMMVAGMLGAVVASMQGVYFETSRGHLRTTQAFFVGDAGLERGKELLNDDPESYKDPRSWPWQADPRDPTNPNKGWFSETITVGAAPGHYDVYADGTGGGGTVTLTAQGQMDTQ
jgi:hypothetical protein